MWACGTRRDKNQIQLENTTWEAAVGCGGASGNSPVSTACPGRVVSAVRECPRVKNSSSCWQLEIVIHGNGCSWDVGDCPQHLLDQPYIYVSHLVSLVGLDLSSWTLPSTTSSRDFLARLQTPLYLHFLDKLFKDAVPPWEFRWFPCSILPVQPLPTTVLGSLAVCAFLVLVGYWLLTVCSTIPVLEPQLLTLS